MQNLNLKWLHLLSLNAQCHPKLFVERTKQTHTQIDFVLCVCPALLTFACLGLKHVLYIRHRCEVENLPHCELLCELNNLVLAA